MTAGAPLLEVEDLRVQFPTPRGVVRAVDGISLRVERGERIAIVGESGSGKSVTAAAVIKLVAPPGRIVSGSIRLEGRELTTLSDRAMSRVRGCDIGLILQNPHTALDPLKSIGSQISETLRLHRGRSRRDAWDDSLELIRDVRIGDPEERVSQYGHQLSGGMSQRALIASAIGARPKLLIADEPTSALDATTADGILELIGDLARDHGMAVMLITHDLGVVAKFADRVIVMYAGRIVEEAPVDELFYSPQHPYTRGLLDSVPGMRGRRAVAAIPGSVPDPTMTPQGCAFHPRCRFAQDTCSSDVPELRRGEGEGRRVACHFSETLAPTLAVPTPVEPVVVTGEQQVGAPVPAVAADVVVVDTLTKSFTVDDGIFRRSGQVRAVDGVSFTIRRGEVLALVGESGSGKSTVARLLLGLEQPTSGRVEFDGRDVFGKDGLERARRHRMQVVFQDPDSSLDPRMTIGAIVAEPLAINGVGTPEERRARAGDLLEQVGLKREYAGRHPHQFSGGQRQRIAIARALALKPDVIVCDEPVTALDVSIQAQVLNLLQDVQRREGLAYLFIAHDLSVVRQLADRVAVMYLGQIVELADADDFFAQAHHPYSIALLAAMSVPDPRVQRRKDRITISGTVPSPFDPPPGCRFHTRCWMAEEICKVTAPPLEGIGANRWAACHFPVGVDAEAQPSRQMTSSAG